MQAANLYDQALATTQRSLNISSSQTPNEGINPSVKAISTAAENPSSWFLKVRSSLQRSGDIRNTSLTTVTASTAIAGMMIPGEWEWVSDAVYINVMIIAGSFTDISALIFLKLNLLIDIG